MKTGFLTLLMCFFTAVLQAQVAPWLWAKGTNGTGDNNGNSIAVDKDGNSYVTGTFSSPFITFGTTTLINDGQYDVFIVKYDPSGNVLWARKASSINDDRAWAIATDSSGNCYVTGHFSSSITFDWLTMNATSSNAVYVVKYNATGGVVWATVAGPMGSGYATPRGLAVDAGGACYITGFCSNEAMLFGSTVLTGGGLWGEDIFVAKLDATGNIVWAKRPSGTDSDHGQGIAVDKKGNCYVTGYFQSNRLDFGTASLSFPFGAKHVFTAKYDSVGNSVWARSCGFFGGQESGTAIAADSIGNTYVTGSFDSPQLSFDTVTLHNEGYSDIFLVKYDTAGSVAWAKNTGGSSLDAANGIALDRHGNSYIAGTFFGAAGTFGNTTLPNGGASNAFVVKFNDTGTVAWAQGVGGSASSFFNSVAVDRPGNSYVCGFYGGVNAPISFGATTLPASNLNSVLTAKRAFCDAAPTQPDTIRGNIMPCAGTPDTFFVTAVNGATTYTWTLPPGWTGTSTTNRIIAIPGITGGTITVTAVNACGTSAVKQLTISSVLPLPVPVITQSGNTLSTTATFASYKWFRNNAPITGAINQVFTYTQGGNYYVVVTNADHCSGQSNTISITLGIEEPGKSAGFIVSPNPVNDIVHVLLHAAIKDNSITLSDFMGRKIRSAELTGGMREVTFDTKGLPAGIYLLTCKNALGTETVKIVKQ